jgi:hypothetical protein
MMDSRGPWALPPSLPLSPSKHDDCAMSADASPLEGGKGKGSEGARRNEGAQTMSGIEGGEGPFIFNLI